MEETLQRLGIYWPKLLAQTINFGIVLFVLWRWAYKPVLSILEQRRQKIEDGIRAAEKNQEELARTETQRQDTLRQAQAEATRLIEEARAIAARVQEQETQKAVAAAEQIIAKAREATVADHARMMTELKREIGRLVVQTTSQVAGKILTPEDQQRLIEETNRQLAA